MLGNYRGPKLRLSKKTGPNSETEKAADKNEALNVFGLLIEKNRNHEVRKVLSFLDGMGFSS